MRNKESFQFSRWDLRHEIIVKISKRHKHSKARKANLIVHSMLPNNGQYLNPWSCLRDIFRNYIRIVKTVSRLLSSFRSAYLLRFAWNKLISKVPDTPCILLVLWLCRRWRNVHLRRNVQYPLYVASHHCQSSELLLLGYLDNLTRMNNYEL